MRFIEEIDNVLLIASAAILFGIAAVWLWLRLTRKSRYGRRCEKKVSKELSRLKGRDYHLIDDILISSGKEGRSVQIDHILVSTRGIFVIETKGHRGHILGTEYGQYWDQRFMMSSKSFYNPLLQNDGHIRALRRNLRGVSQELFVSMVVFTDCWRMDVKADEIVERRNVFGERHIKRTLDPARRRKRRWWSRRGEVVLDERKQVMELSSLRDEIRRRPKILERETAAAIAGKIRSMDIKGRKARSSHNAFARSAAKNGYRDIRNGRCPRCGGMLVMREGDFGPYYGCSNYPDCRFMCSVNPK